MAIGRCREGGVRCDKQRWTDRQGSPAGDNQLQSSDFAPRIIRHRSGGPLHDLRRLGPGNFPRRTQADEASDVNSVMKKREEMMLIRARYLTGCAALALAAL